MHWAQTDFRLEKCSQTQPRSSSSSASPLSLFSHFHQPPHRCFPLITAAPESGESVSSSCRSVPSLAGMELGRAEQADVNQLIGRWINWLGIQESYVWKTQITNGELENLTHECGVIIFVTPSLWNLFVHYVNECWDIMIYSRKVF